MLNFADWGESSLTWPEWAKKSFLYYNPMTDDAWLTHDEQDALGGRGLEHGRIAGHFAPVLTGCLERYVIQNDLSFGW